MYLAILETNYEIYAIGQTEEDVRRNIVKGYKRMYPRKEDRSVEKVTYEELNDFFGIAIYEIGKRGYAIEGGLW